MSTKFDNFEAFKSYRESLEANKAEEIEIRVAMATCAIATGAQTTYEVLEDAIAQHGLDHVRLKKTGCLGYCYAEPTVEIVRPGQDTVAYGPVDQELATRIILEDVIGGNRTDGLLATNHQNA